MCKFLFALALAFTFLGTSAHAQITVANDNGTSSGRIDNSSSYAVQLPTGVEDGDLVVVAVASDTVAPLSADGYIARIAQGFNDNANRCYEFYHVWKTGDSMSPLFSRSATGSDAYAVVVLSGVRASRFVDTETGTSAAGTGVSLPGITTRNDNEMDVYLGCADAGATFSASAGTIAVQQAGTYSSVAINTIVQPNKGKFYPPGPQMDANLPNGSAVIALIPATDVDAVGEPDPEGD